MSDLRDRIAKVLWTRFAPQIELGVDGTWEQQHPVAREMWREDADEIILALGLRENFAVADEDGDFVYVGADRENSAKYTVHPGDHLMRRYVTDWRADDE